MTLALPGACLVALAYGIAVGLHIAYVTAYDASPLLAKQTGRLRDRFAIRLGEAPEVPESVLETMRTLYTV